LEYILPFKFFYLKDAQLIGKFRGEMGYEKEKAKTLVSYENN
jgi:hypothetical protein